MSMNWVEKESWYAPLQREEPKPESAPVPERKKRRRRGQKAWPWFVVLGVLVLLLVGSSLLFSEKGAAPAVNEPDSADKMPKDAADFFAGFYDRIETEKARTDVPKAATVPDFTLRFQDARAGEELNTQELYERCAPSIVAITCTDTSGLGGRWGSGIILSENGLILTNCHMIEDCRAVEVTLWDDRSFDAELVGADAITDLAVLRIPAQDLPAAAFGDSAALRVGDRVAAIGNPLGARFRSTLTDGIISGIDRGVPYNGHSLTVLQTNTAINQGSSGGALFNMYGQVVGVTNMKMNPAYYGFEGIAFAIPTSTVYDVVNDILTYGQVTGRAAVGITLGEIPAEAREEYALPDGLYVSDVVKGSDAEAKGIRVGDVVTAVDGTQVSSLSQVSGLKDGKKVGDTMTFTVWREGETLEIEVRLMDQDEIYPS